LKLSRRALLGLLPVGLSAQPARGRIDRRAIVERHSPVLHGFDPSSPLSVGNGEFTFTADATGLQTFPQLYEKSMPLCTMAQWGWHTSPNPTGQGPAEFRPTMFDTYGRAVPYNTDSRNQRELYDWLRENPHRVHLGRIGFDIASPSDVRIIEQKLDLWAGVLHSRFEWKGGIVEVETCCHPTLDALAVRIRGTAPPVIIEFPCGSPGMSAADWTHPDRHVTTEIPGGLLRKLDNDSYTVKVSGSEISRAGPHRFIVANPAQCTIGFGQTAIPAASQSFAAAGEHWSNFWSTGSASDVSHSPELERRIVLSQYLTAIQCSGSLPPAETGLTCNSWYGKYHLEMHYWHAAHFAAWGRAQLLERSLAWYNKILPSARERARTQGYTGARWPKMTAPDGRDSPSPIGPLLIWQQPHPITMAELCYQSHPDRKTLDSYGDIVFASAEFMASYAHLDPKRNQYVLGPPVIPAQENHPPRETWNPTFELEYWHDALETAQRWRERLGMKRDPRWEDVRTRLSPLPVKDGVYLAHENCPQTFTERNRDHPSMLCALGMLPGAKVDRETMRRTLKKVIAEWKWPEVWGWDFSVVAMTAASLGESTLAMDALLMDSPKNTWLPNGHNWQRPDLPCYLPGNGALLLAIAHMARLNAFPPGWSPRWEDARQPA
jgi:hypothetical protein